jgi:hypothetical protein
MPYFSLPFVVQHAANFLIFVIKGLFSGSFGENLLGPKNQIDMFAVVPPLSLLFYLFGGIPAVVKEFQERRIGVHILLNLWLWAGVLLVGVLSGGGYHDFRYLLPFFPAYVAYLIPGVRTLALSIANASRIFTPRQLAIGLAAYLLCFQALTTLNFVLHYGQLSYSFLEYKDAALWAKTHTEPDARIAALDVGLIAYYSNRYVYDLYGLVTNEMTGNTEYYTTGMGSKYEHLEQLPEERQPDYFFSHRVRFEDSGNENFYAFFKQQPVYRVTPRATQYPRIGDDLSLYKLGWESQHDADMLYSPEVRQQVASLRLVDEVDITDLESQATHNYEFLPLVPDGFAKNRPIGTTYASGEFVSDGALFITGGEYFIIDLEQQRPVVLILRTAGVEPPGAMVIVNGESAGLLATDSPPQQWSEVALQIPESLVQQGKNSIQVVGNYISAHYWVYQ